MRPRPTLQLAALVVLALALPAGPGPAAAPAPGGPSAGAPEARSGAAPDVRSPDVRSADVQPAAPSPGAPSVGARSGGVRPATRASDTRSSAAAQPAEPAAEGATGTLTVVVDGLASDAGTVAFALYGSAESYAELGEPVRKGRLPIDGRKCRWKVEELPAGDYAVSLYHDVDGDGELDKGSFGAPTEPYGFSNDARATFGPPGWDKARFRFDGTDREVRVRVR